VILVATIPQDVAANEHADQNKPPEPPCAVWRCAGRSASDDCTGFEYGVKPSTAPKNCVKVTTGTGPSTDGYVNINVDQGQGLKPVTPSGKRYGQGEVVLDKCYGSLMAVAVQNSKNDAWMGSVLFYREGSGSLSPGDCDTCTTAGGTTRIVVDGNSDGGNQSPTACLNRETCSIVPGSSEAAAVGDVNGTVPVDGMQGSNKVCKGNSGVVHVSSCVKGSTRTPPWCGHWAFGCLLAKGWAEWCFGG